MSSNMTRDDRKALRNRGVYWKRRKEERERMMKQAEREITFGHTEYPEHAAPLRTPSGTRFGW